MLISESVAEEIWNTIRERTGAAPRINKDQIREISYRFLEPLLDFLVMSVEDVPSGNLIAKDLLHLLAGPIPQESGYLESGFGEEIQPDPFLKESIEAILSKNLSQTASAELRESETQSTFSIIYPVVYKLLHEYRLNKDPNRPDIDDVNMLMALSEQPFLSIYRKLSQRLSQSSDAGQMVSEPSSYEVEVVVVKGFHLKRDALSMVCVDRDISTIEKAKFLHASIILGLPNIVELLIKDKGADPHVEIDNFNALSLACYGGSLALVKVLIKNGALINAVSSVSGYAALHEASQNGRYDVVLFLLESGADITMLFKGSSVLCLVSQNGHASVVRLLVLHKDIQKIINLSRESGETPLWIATSRGHYEIVQLLLEAGADITIPFKGITALSIASLIGNAPMVEAFSRHKNIQRIINSTEEGGTAPLFNAGANGHHEIAQLLLDSGADLAATGIDGCSALHMACDGNYALVAKIFLAHKDIKKTINLREKRGATALYLACQNGHYEIVQLLLEAGADITVASLNGCSVLYVACQNNHVSIVKMLLVHKEIQNIINIFAEGGATALSMASAKGHHEIVQLLLEAGADIAIIMIDGGSALHVACQNNHVFVVKLFVTHKDIQKVINLIGIGKTGETALVAASGRGHHEVVQLLLEAGADIAITTLDGYSALYAACHNNHVFVVKLFLEHNDGQKMVNFKNKFGESLLYMASAKGHHGVVQLLLEAGSDLTITTPKDECSALHMACHQNNLSIVKLFIAHKDIQKIINHPLKSGFTPLMIAHDQKNFEIAQLLLEAGAAPDPRVSEYAKDTAVHFAYAPPNHAPLMQYTEQEIKQLNKQGVEAFKAQNYQEAIPLFQQVLQYWERVDKTMNPGAALSKASVLYNLGSAEMKCGHIPEAKGYLQRAIVIAQSVGAEKETEKFTKRLAECEEPVADQGDRLKARI